MTLLNELAKAQFSCKRILLPLILSFIFSFQGLAQGYIDCATLLADDDNYDYGHSDAKVKGGYTYMVADVSLNGYSNDQLLPVINGDSYHGLPGGEKDIYFAIFDTGCNQILGTYLGGTGEEDYPALDFDAAGNIVLVWQTNSADFQSTDGTTYVGNGSETDLVIAKFAPNGTLLFSTVYGGAEDHELDSKILVDGTDTYIYGKTESDDFPTTDGTTLSGTSDAFVLKYDGSGNLVYATVLGGSGTDEFEHAVVVNGCLYVTGKIFGTNDFVGTDGSVGAGGGNDVLFAKYDVNGNLVFSTVIGGNDIENTNGGLLTDGTHVYLVGYTESADFPTTDGSTHNGGGIPDFYVQKYDLSGNLIFSKLYGGNGQEKMFDLAQLVNGEIYITGESSSSDFPVIGGLPYSGSGDDMLLFKLDTNGNLLASTFYPEGTAGPIYINNAGEIYTFAYTPGGSYTTDGTGGNSGLAFIKFNTDLSICVASVTNHATLSDEFEVTCFEVIGDTIYAPYLTADFSSPNISTDGSNFQNNNVFWHAFRILIFRTKIIIHRHPLPPVIPLFI